MADSPALTYGGQAVLEGVMMRGRRFASVAVRAPSSAIVLRTERLPQRLYSGPISRIPFLRGLILLWDALGLGMKALMFSADVAMQGEEVQMSKSAQWGTLAVSLALGVGLFFVVPLLLASLAEPAVDSSVITNLIEGLIRLAFLVAYVGLIGLLPDIRRVYGYHGAEHMTIHAFEHGQPLDAEHISTHPPEHPRCGTAFLLQVVAISIVIFSLLGNPDIGWRILSRIVLIPVIAGVAYEVLKFGGAHATNPLVNALVWPGLMLQKLTTRQPEPSMIEVAVAAFTEMRRAEADVERAGMGPAPTEAAA